MNLYLSKGTEDNATAIQAILSLPPATRQSFYASEKGQELCKGLGVDLASVHTKDNPQDWTAAELEETWEKVYQASPEGQEIVISLLPGPIASIMRERLTAPKPNDFIDWGKRPQGYPLMNKSVEAESSDEEIEKGGGPRKGTAGYEVWHQKIIASRAAKKKMPTSPSKRVHSTENKIKENSAKVPRKHRYAHFIRKVGRGGRIVDKPQEKHTV